MINTILLEPLFNILLFFYALVPGASFGVAVILLTLVIRLAMWPLVKKQIHQQKAMKELQPDIAKIKKKAKGNKQKESEMMMELFKEKQINPLSSVGLILLQFPILIALFFVLRNVVEASNIAENTYSFVENMPAIQKILNNPDAFDPTLFGFVHMAESSLILAGLAGLAQYIQVRQMTPQKESSEKEGSSANKMMSQNFTKFLPLVAVVVGSQLPSALPLYWVVSSLVATLQQHIILSEEVTLAQKLDPRQLDPRRGKGKKAAETAQKAGGSASGSKKPKQQPAKTQTQKSKSQTKNQKKPANKSASSKSNKSKTQATKKTTTPKAAYQEAQPNTKKG